MVNVFSMKKYIFLTTTIFIIHQKGVFLQKSDCIIKAQENGKKNGFWIPACDENGKYSAIQCKGDKSNGRCFCFDEDGNRIFGWSWWKSADNMTCACSRHVENLKASGRFDVTLHCTENGNYENLQCDNGLCWCADYKTGSPSQRTYPEALMKFLPCYDNIGRQYLRQCESKAVGEAELLTTLEIHGRKYTHLDINICSSNGLYGRYAINKQMVRCTSPDGKRIENYQTTVVNILKVNCNCARDSLIFLGVNKQFQLICETNGNYQPLQYSGGQPYCIDQDGFPTTDLGRIGQSLNCPVS